MTIQCATSLIIVQGLKHTACRASVNGDAADQCHNTTFNLERLDGSSTNYATSGLTRFVVLASATSPGRRSCPCCRAPAAAAPKNAARSKMPQVRPTSKHESIWTPLPGLCAAPPSAYTCACTYTYVELHIHMHMHKQPCEQTNERERKRENVLHVFTCLTQTCRYM